MNVILQLLLKAWLVKYLTRESAAKDAVIQTSLSLGNKVVADGIAALPSMSKVLFSATGGGTPEFYVDGVRVPVIHLADGRVVTNAFLVSRAKTVEKRNADGTVTMVAKPVVYEVKQEGYDYTPAKRTLTPAEATIPVSFKGTKKPTPPPPVNQGYGVKWGWSATDPYQSLLKGTVLPVQGSLLINDVASAYDTDFHLMPSQHYAFVEEDVAMVVKNKVQDTGSERNVAYPEDDVWRAPFVVGTKRYYVTRIPTDYDTKESSRVAFSRI